jgi:hypothetical protein
MELHGGADAHDSFHGLNPALEHVHMSLTEQLSAGWDIRQFRIGQPREAVP